MGEKQAEKAAGESLVVFIGNTGSGKSTLANYLAGCEMRLVDPKSFGITGLSKKVVAVKGIQQGGPTDELMPIGHTKQSMTFIPMIESGKSGLMFCDCPGFFDNRGAEISIANAVNIKRMLAAAQGVKIVLAVNYHSLQADRGRGLKEMIAVACHLFGSKENLIQHADSLLFCVTQIPRRKSDDGDEERQTLDDLREYLVTPSLEDPLEQQVVLTLSEKLFIYDPMDQDRLEIGGAINREDILGQIWGLEEVEEPQTLFQTSLSKSEEHALKEISDAINVSIQASLKESDYKRAAQSLAQLAKLEALEHSYVIRLMTAARQRIGHHFSAIIQEIDQLCSDLANDQLLQAWLLFKEMKEALTHFDEEICSAIDVDALSRRLVRYKKKMESKEKEQELVELSVVLHHFCQEPNFNAAQAVLREIEEKVEEFERAFSDFDIEYSIDIGALKKLYATSKRKHDEQLRHEEEREKEQKALERKRKQEVEAKKRRERERQEELEAERAEQQRIRREAALERESRAEQEREREKERRREEEREERKRAREEREEERQREREEREEARQMQAMMQQRMMYNAMQYQAAMRMGGFGPPPWY